MTEIKRQPGTVAPWEYDWKSEFSFYDIHAPYISMDVGKVRGLAIAYQESLKEIENIKAELEKVKTERERLGVLAIKLCDTNHPDWDEIVKLTAFLEEDK